MPEPQPSRGPAAGGRIVYAGFATRRHSGGVHVLTQHVALLRDAGLEAWFWLPDADDHPEWIGRDVPTLYGPTLSIEADDLLVLPEAPLPAGVAPAPGARTVIFNQNHFYTFVSAPDAPTDFPGWDPPPTLWTVSTESQDVIEAVLPGLETALVPNLVDVELFRPRGEDRPRVSWFPKKRPREAGLLARALANDPRLTGVQLSPLVDLTRPQVADALGRTTVFVALGHSESFGLPVAEALASSCLVVGYDGGGGVELFEAPGAWAVPEQRPLLLREAVVDLLTRVEELAPARTANRAWVSDRYPASRTSAALLAAVERARSRPGRASTATHPAAWLHLLEPGFTAWG